MIDESNQLYVIDSVEVLFNRKNRNKVLFFRKEVLIENGSTIILKAISKVSELNKNTCSTSFSRCIKRHANNNEFEQCEISKVKK